MKSVISKLGRFSKRLFLLLALTFSAFDSFPELQGAAVDFQSAGQEILLPFGQGDFEVGDLNLDQHPDILVTLDGVTTLYLNNGAGLFSESGNLFDGTVVLGVKLFDADQDGDLDAWLFEAGGQVSIWILETDGSLVRSPETLTVASDENVVFGDVDSDGDLDVLVSSKLNMAAPEPFQFGGHYRWINNGEGVFGDPELLRYDTSGKSVDGVGGELGDLDGDGDLDFLAAYSDHSLRVWMNDGGGRFTDSQQSLRIADELGEDDDAIGTSVLGDFDADGDLDIIKPVARSRNWLWLNEGDASFLSSPVDFSPLLTAVETGDLDNDGDLDLIAAGAGCQECANTWLQNDGGLEETSIRIFGDNATVHRLKRVDLDSDGDLDFVALVDIFEAPAGRAVVGMWLNGFIDRSVQPALVGTITDATLSFVMRQRLGLPPDLSVKPDYSGLTSLVILESDFGSSFDPIRNLNGLEEATELERIMIDGVMDVAGSQGILDLRFLDTLDHLKVLSLKANGIAELILPKRWKLLESLWLDDNRLVQFDSTDDYPSLKVLSLPRNLLENFSINGASVRLEKLDLTDNPLTDLNLFAGIPELTPTIEAVRNLGVNVVLSTRLSPILPLIPGQRGIEVLADSGRYSVRRSVDVVNWNIIGEFEISQAGWPGVTFVDDSGTAGETAFYSLQPIGQ